MILQHSDVYQILKRKITGIKCIYFFENLLLIYIILFNCREAERQREVNVLIPCSSGHIYREYKDYLRVTLLKRINRCLLVCRTRNRNIPCYQTISRLLLFVSQAICCLPINLNPRRILPKRNR